MSKKIGQVVTLLAVFASVTMVTGCLSGVFTYDPTTERATISVTPLEGTWYSASNGNYYDITATGGTYELVCYKLNARDGSKEIDKFKMETLDKGEKSAETISSGYLYGYNKNRPGWIAYYYTINGNNLTMTSLITAGGGATWSSLSDAKAGADKNYTGTVKLNLSKK